MWGRLKGERARGYSRCVVRSSEATADSDAEGTSEVGRGKKVSGVDRFRKIAIQSLLSLVPSTRVTQRSIASEASNYEMM